MPDWHASRETDKQKIKATRKQDLKLNLNIETS